MTRGIRDRREKENEGSGQEGCGRGEMQDRMDRKGGTQDSRDAGLEGRRKGGIRGTRQSFF